MMRPGPPQARAEEEVVETTDEYDSSTSDQAQALARARLHVERRARS